MSCFCASELGASRRGHGARGLGSGFFKAAVLVGGRQRLLPETRVSEYI